MRRILMGGKGDCPFLSALFGTVEMSAGARSGYGARLGFWVSGMAYGEESEEESGMLKALNMSRSRRL